MALSTDAQQMLDAVGYDQTQGKTWFNSASDADKASVSSNAMNQFGWSQAQADAAFGNMMGTSTPLETGLNNWTNSGNFGDGTNTNTETMVPGVANSPSTILDNGLSDLAQKMLTAGGLGSQAEGISWLNNATPAQLAEIHANTLGMYNVSSPEVDAAIRSIQGLPPIEHSYDTGSTGGTGGTDTITGAGALDQLLQPDLFSSSNATSNQSSDSYSGLPTGVRDNLLADLMPQLMESYSDLPGQIDNWTDHNLAASHSASKNLLDGNLTNVLADLAKRGMIDSSVASDGISQAATSVANSQAALDQATLANAAAQKLQVPSTLSGIANLGSSSSSNSTSNSSSTSSNPLEPYQLYAQMLAGLM